MNRDQIFAALDLDDLSHGAYAGGWLESSGELLNSVNPTTEEPIGSIVQASLDDYEIVVASAEETFVEWRMLPAPKRGEYVRRLADALTDVKEPLGALVALEMGKIHAEGEGEVQEMIDVADFAVGLSRQLYGLTMASERPGHRMYEQWHPLGPVGVITAFNFPVAVWSWNALIAAVCGDTVIWKPSSQTPLSAVAVTNIAHEVMAGSGFEGVFNLSAGRGPNGRRRPDQRPPRPADFGDGVVQHGRIGGHGRCQATRPIAARARWQQRHNRHGGRRSGSGDTCSLVRCGRHVRTAVHQLAASHRAERGVRSCFKASGRGLPASPHR